MTESITHGTRRPSHGRAVGLVAFLFGVTGRPEIPGVALRRMLDDVGTGPDAARALLARMRRRGQLATTRRGREVDYRLDGAFARDFERIRDRRMIAPLTWEGHFHAVLHSVPEQHRAFRDTLRREAVLAGYGVAGPGLLICTSDRFAALRALIEQAPDGARIWAATLGMPVAQAAQAASLAWDLPQLDVTFAAHLARLRAVTAGPAARSDTEVFATFVHELLPVLIDLGRQPRLPAELTPPGWVGTDLGQAVGRFTTAHERQVRSYLEHVLD